MLSVQFEAYSEETFHCGYCKHSFSAPVATWVDVSREPRVRTLLRQWEFNIVTCPRCGNRQFSESPFFYEDFTEGLLIAVFPIIPVNRASLEEAIREKYGYYPRLEFFYDMTQLWFLIYLQDHYQDGGSLHGPSIVGRGEKRLKRFLLFLKKDPMMLTIRETLTDKFLGTKTDEDLQDVLWRALAKLEGTARRRRADAASAEASGSEQ